MLDIARQRAEGLSNIRFVEGNAVDLAMFQDRAFDLVLNMDGAISFCGCICAAHRSITSSPERKPKKMLRERLSKTSIAECTKIPLHVGRE